MTNAFFTDLGFRQEACGGNTQAWRKDIADGSYVLLCYGEGDLDGPANHADWTACVYDDAQGGEAIGGAYNVWLANALEFVAKLGQAA